MKRFIEFISDGDNVAWSRCRAFRRKSRETADVTEFCEVVLCAIEVDFVYSGDFKLESDWKLIVEPFVNLDILIIADAAEFHRCQNVN